MPFGRSGPLWFCRAVTAYRYFNKPAALSQSLTNGTPGRKEAEGKKEGEKTVPCFILAPFSPSVGIHLINY